MGSAFHLPFRSDPSLEGGSEPNSIDINERVGRGGNADSSIVVCWLRADPAFSIALINSIIFCGRFSVCDDEWRSGGH